MSTSITIGRVPRSLRGRARGETPRRTGSGECDGGLQEGARQICEMTAPGTVSWAISVSFSALRPSERAFLGFGAMGNLGGQPRGIPPAAASHFSDVHPLQDARLTRPEEGAYRALLQSRTARSPANNASPCGMQRGLSPRAGRSWRIGRGGGAARRRLPGQEPVPAGGRLRTGGPDTTIVCAPWAGWTSFLPGSASNSLSFGAAGPFRRPPFAGAVRVQAARNRSRERVSWSKCST